MLVAPKSFIENDLLEERTTANPHMFLAEPKLSVRVTNHILLIILLLPNNPKIFKAVEDRFMLTLFLPLIIYSGIERTLGKLHMIVNIT